MLGGISIGATEYILLGLFGLLSTVLWEYFDFTKKICNKLKKNKECISKEDIEFLLDGFWKDNWFIYKNPSPRGVLINNKTKTFFKEPSYPALVGHFENLNLNNGNDYFFQHTLLARAPHNAKASIRFLTEESENITITIYDAEKQEKICLPNHAIEVNLDKDSNFHFMILGKKEVSLDIKIEIMKWTTL